MSNVRRYGAQGLFSLSSLATTQLSILSTLAAPLNTLALRDGPSSNSSNSSGSSDGPFQSLASGTQDLSALVGLFATDSVENFAFDYTKGFIVPAMANYSLLGFLGYIRGLLKLAIGAKACQRAGFSLGPLQPYLGIGSDNTLPKDNFVHVFYLERERTKTFVEWRVRKFLQHTEQSLPASCCRNYDDTIGEKFLVRSVLLWNNSTWPGLLTASTLLGSVRRFIHSEKSDERINSSRACFESYRFEPYPRTTMLVGVIVCLVGAAASSFLILFLSTKTWESIFSSVGLFVSMSLGSLTWMWTFYSEQMPIKSCKWFNSEDNTPSLQRRGAFAFWKDKNQYGAFDCAAVAGRLGYFTRAVSFISAVLGATSYVFQYAALRNASNTQAGIWLGCQGGLILLRILVWIWQPKFQALGDLASENEVQKLLMSEGELLLLWFSSFDYELSRLNELYEPLDEKFVPIQFPLWLVEFLPNLDVCRDLALARRMRTEPLDDIAELSATQEAIEWWQFPGQLFLRWLNHQISLEDDKPPVEPESPSDIVCRLIRTKEGKLHILPGVSLWFWWQNTEPSQTDIIDVIFFAVPQNAGSTEQSLLDGGLCVVQKRSGLRFQEAGGTETFFHGLTEARRNRHATARDGWLMIEKGLQAWKEMWAKLDQVVSPTRDHW